MLRMYVKTIKQC